MTNDEAIKELKIIREDYWDEYGDPMPALDMAIKALEQESCYNLDEWCHDCSEYNQDKHCCPRFNKVIRKAVEEIKQPRGHWVTKIKSDLRGDMWPTNPKCSECGGEPYYSNTIHSYKFCPYCGVKMESEEIDADSN